jgi:hypothetical protein
LLAETVGAGIQRPTGVRVFLLRQWTSRLAPDIRVMQP